MPPPTPRRSATVGDGPLGEAARVLADRRRVLGLTQRDLADLADTSERTVQSVEHGTATVRFDVMTRLADALGLTIVFAGQPAVSALERHSGVAVQPVARQRR